MTATAHRDRLLLDVATSSRSTERYGADAVMRLSNVGYCLRRSWYTAQGRAFADSAMPTAVSPEGRWEMEDGDLHEVDIIRRLERQGYVMENVRRSLDDTTQLTVFVRLSDGTLVPGHPDGIIVAGPDITERTLFEAKSMSGGRFIDSFRQGLRAGHREYWLQAQGYMLAESINRCLMFIKAKDSSVVKQRLRKAEKEEGVNPKLHVVELAADPTSQQEVLDRFETLLLSIKTGRPPAGEYSLLGGDWQCRYCPFINICPNGLGGSDAEEI